MAKITPITFTEEWNTGTVTGWSPTKAAPTGKKITTEAATAKEAARWKDLIEAVATPGRIATAMTGRKSSAGGTGITGSATIGNIYKIRK
jgi:hypothetical protein